MDGIFIDEYKKDMIRTIQRINPDWSDEYIEEIIDSKLKKMNDVNISADNNVTGSRKDDVSLLAMFDWILDRKPIIAGNGTFYKPQDEAINPSGTMLNNLKAERAALKKKMFATPDSDVMKKLMLDLSQANKKVDMNSYYGGSGMPGAAFYSKWSGPATTLSAQSVISTTEQMFEAFIADNYQFVDITELCHWIEICLKDDIKFEKFIKHHTIEEVRDRLCSKIIKDSEYDDEIIESILNNLSQDEIDLLYYKNNLLQFIKDHKEISNIFEAILSSVVNGEYNGDRSHDKKVNSEYFMDPNNPPDSIVEYLKELKKYVMNYVYVNYLSFDRIYRLRNFKRRCVTVIDTDSNILSFDTIMEYILDKIVQGRTFGRPYLNNIFILVNSITYLVTEAVSRILYLYGKSSNICEKYIAQYSMKNEFFFIKLIIGTAKKRYISKILLREGNLLNPPKADIKGFDFKKSSCSDFAEAAFMKIIRNNIIDSNEVNIRGMMVDLKAFRDSIHNSILSGDTQMLQNTSVKDISAYANPASQMGLRAVIAWNYIYPDDKIEFPAKVSLLKLKAFNIEDIADLETTYPDIYNILVDKIFNDTTGLFVIHKSTVNKKTGKTTYKTESKGFQGIAIPTNRKIPEWLFPYVDWSTTINNIIAPFMPVLAIFGNRPVEEGKTYGSVNRKSNRFTNIVKF